MKEIVDALNTLLKTDPNLCRQMLIPFGVTREREMVEQSPFVFRELPNGREFTISAFGLLNGFCHNTGKVICWELDDETEEIKGFHLRDSETYVIIDETVAD